MIENILKFFPESEEPLLDFLHRCRSAVDWQRVIQNGQLKVHGYLLGCGYRVRPGDVISWKTDGPFAEPPVSRDLTVVYEDEWLLAVNKPAPLPVHPCGAYLKNTLTAIMEQRCGLQLHLLHRLDTETSGIILLAKKSASVKECLKQLSCARKTYLVGVEGPFPGRLRVDLPLGTRPGSLVRKRQCHVPDGKRACTLFRRIFTRRTSCLPVFSLLMARPLTGRMHQIRVHLRESGFHVAGDKIYGRDERYFLQFLAEGNSPALCAALKLSRQFLHAWKLSIRHPENGKLLQLKAPVPAELREFGEM